MSLCHQTSVETLREFKAMTPTRQTFSGSATNSRGKRHQLLTIPKHSEISAVTALCKLIVNWDDRQCTDAEAGSELQTAAAAARLAGMTGTAAYWAEPYWAGLAAK